MRAFIVISLFFLLPSQSIFAQGQNPVKPQDLREADATFSKRTWRVIDLREKQNKPAVWPGNPINKILYNAVLSGQLKPYKDDSLKRYYDLEKFVQLGSDTEYVEVPIDPDDPTITKTETVVTPFDPEAGIRWLLVMEDWYFSKKYSRQFSRIIAVAPLYRARVGGIELGIQPLCWFKYYDRFDKETDCRDILVKQKIFNPRNQAAQLTFDDWFEQRLFSSYIIKVSNQYDYTISTMPEFKNNGIDALLEAERLKQEMIETEQDRWEH